MKDPSQRGSVLVGVLGMALVLAIIVAVVMSATTAENRSSVDYAVAAKALGLAEAGIEHVYARVNEDFDAHGIDYLASNKDQYIDSEEESPTIEWDTGTARILDVVVEKDVPETGNHRVHVLSKGTVHSPFKERTVLVVLEYGPFYGLFDHAVAAYGPGATVTLSGGNAGIDGTVYANGYLWNHFTNEGQVGDVFYSTAVTKDDNDTAKQKAPPSNLPHNYIEELIEDVKYEGKRYLKQTKAASSVPLDNPGYYQDYWTQKELQDIFDSYMEWCDEEGEFTVDIDGVWYIDGDATFNGNDELWGHYEEAAPSPEDEWFHFLPLFIVQGDIKINGGAHIIKAFFYSVDGEIDVMGDGYIKGAVASGGDKEIKVSGGAEIIYPEDWEGGAGPLTYDGWIRSSWVESSVITQGN